jgi:hypothetical protein
MPNTAPPDPASANQATNIELSPIRPVNDGCIVYSSTVSHRSS